MTTWTAPEAHRESEPLTGDERAMLQGWLNWHRQTLLQKCTGLTAEQLKTASVEPSNLTLLGLVRHMTEVERGWFRKGAARLELPDPYSTAENPDADLTDLADADADECLAAFRDELVMSDEAVAGLPLDAEHPGRRSPISLRWVYLHMIEEYARHNGHADLIRERIDGATGD